MRIALFGQAAFARDIVRRLVDAEHEIAAVYGPPPGGRPDPLVEEAEARGLRLLRHRHFRRQGRAIEERVKEHAELGVDLNVLAYVTVILPPEIVDAPAHASLCFHPSLLPRFRGGNAIPWQIILGEPESGVSVFRPDAGIDTGPIVVQRGGIPIGPYDTAASLYYDKLYPLGVEAMCEAVERVARGSAQPQPQDESRASFQGLVTDEVACLAWSRPGVELDRRIRGCDPQPGARARWQGRPVRFYAARWLPGGAEAPPGEVVGAEEGSLIVAVPGGRLAIGRMRIDEGEKRVAAEAGPRLGERFQDAP